MRVNFISVVACCLLAGGTARADETFNSIDLDHDGRIDEQEAQAAGRAVFQRLDANRDGNLDVPEINGRLGPAVLKAADPGADRALNGEEYATLITARFKAANTDADGKVDQDELKTLTGALLLLMIK